MCTLIGIRNAMHYVCVPTLSIVYTSSHLGKICYVPHMTYDSCHVVHAVYLDSSIAPCATFRNVSTCYTMLLRTALYHKKGCYGIFCNVTHNCGLQQLAMLTAAIHCTILLHRVVLYRATTAGCSLPPNLWAVTYARCLRDLLLPWLSEPGFALLSLIFKTCLSTYLRCLYHVI